MKANADDVASSLFRGAITSERSHERSSSWEAMGRDASLVIYAAAATATASQMQKPARKCQWRGGKKENAANRIVTDIFFVFEPRPRNSHKKTRSSSHTLHHSLARCHTDAHTSRYRRSDVRRSTQSGDDAHCEEVTWLGTLCRDVLVRTNYYQQYLTLQPSAPLQGASIGRPQRSEYRFC